MMKNKKLAGLLSVIFPGLGHLYVGRYVDGAGFLLGAATLWGVLAFKGAYLWEVGGWRTVIFGGGFVTLYVYGLVDVLRKGWGRRK